MFFPEFFIKHLKIALPKGGKEKGIKITVALQDSDIFPVLGDSTN